MASELAERRAALRHLLVEQVETSSPTPVGGAAAARRGGEPGRLRMVLVTGAVAVAVVLGSVVALQVSQHRVGRIAAPPTSSASTTDAPSPTSRPLITPSGWHELTRQQLHDDVARSATLLQKPDDGAIFEEQAWLEIRCMAEAGFVYDPIAVLEQDTDGLPGLTAAQARRYSVALLGPTTDAPYDWRTAGCHGSSVHETGQDDDH